MDLEKLEARITSIEERNVRVEKNKIWETSPVRRISIALLTYTSIVCYHLAIGAKNVFVISAVPVVGFILSTLSLGFIRNIFEKRKNEK
ncbi:MAG: hypothetical protein U0R17_02615 [Acidimicrobiia bacterium]